MPTKGNPAEAMSARGFKEQLLVTLGIACCLKDDLIVISSPMVKERFRADIGLSKPLSENGSPTVSTMREIYGDPMVLLRHIISAIDYLKKDTNPYSDASDLEYDQQADLVSRLCDRIVSEEIKNKDSYRRHLRPDIFAKQCQWNPTTSVVENMARFRAGGDKDAIYLGQLRMQMIKHALDLFQDVEICIRASYVKELDLYKAEMNRMTAETVPLYDALGRVGCDFIDEVVRRGGKVTAAGMFGSTNGVLHKDGRILVPSIDSKHKLNTQYSSADLKQGVRLTSSDFRVECLDAKGKPFAVRISADDYAIYGKSDTKPAIDHDLIIRTGAETVADCDKDGLMRDFLRFRFGDADVDMGR